MKVIFLDIDGVLNCATTEDHAPGGAIGIERRCVKALRLIVEATGAKIVLTSTWKSEWSPYWERCSPDMVYLMRELAKEGLTIFSKTEDDIKHRGKGIDDWLRCFGPDVGSNVTDWVVLDDEVFIDFLQYPDIVPRLVQTSFGGDGLTEELAARAIRILIGEPTTRPPAEIKKGLECCSFDSIHCGKGCPYEDDCHTKERFKNLEKDALTFITQLEAENSRRLDVIDTLTELLAAAHDETAKMKAERDAAVEDMRGCCDVCKWERTAKCGSCKYEEYAPAPTNDNWEWLGVKEEST